MLCYMLYINMLFCYIIYVINLSQKIHPSSAKDCAMNVMAIAVCVTLK